MDGSKAYYEAEQVVKDGENAALIVAPGVYFPREMPTPALAYQIINKVTGVIEFEEVQLASAWEAFQHFDKHLGDIHAEMRGEKKSPNIELISSTGFPLGDASDEPKH